MEPEISDTEINTDFEGHSILLNIIDEILEEDQVPDIDNENATKFRNLLLDENFINDREINITDKKVMDVVKSLIRSTPIPGPGDDMYNEMYKTLVEKFTKKFEEAQTNRLEAEVTARKLAAWIMKFSDMLKKHGQDKNDRKASQRSSLNSDTLSYHLPEEDKNLKIYNFSTYQTQPFLAKPGNVVELQDKQGSKIFVKGLAQGDRQKTLVKKVKNTGEGKQEVSSWLVELADREQAKSITETISTSSPSKALKIPLTIDEWKKIADIRSEEVKAWKKKLGLENLQEERTEPSHSEHTSATRNRARPSSSTKSQHDRNTNEVDNTNKNRFLTRISGQTKNLRNSMVTNFKKPSTTYTVWNKEKKQEHKLRKKNLSSQTEVLDGSTHSF